MHANSMMQGVVVLCQVYFSLKDACTARAERMIVGIQPALSVLLSYSAVKSNYMNNKRMINPRFYY